jgi:multidrug transporter EmrE-like cation transporter
MFVMYIGTAFMLAVLKIIAKSYRIEVNKGILASTVALTLLGLGCCVFMFIGSNALANVNMASIAIPILQGTAIGGFALYGALVLKEKSSLIKWGGIVAIILGIIFMSL